MNIDRRTRPTAPRERDILASTQTEAMLGFCAYGVSRLPPANASADFMSGYRMHRDQVVSQLTAVV